MQIPCVYLPGPAPAVTVANSNYCIYDVIIVQIIDRLVSPWICPVTGLEMNGRFKFVFAFSTGKVRLTPHSNIVINI
jgi:hypothetical protein